MTDTPLITQLGQAAKAAARTLASAGTAAKNRALLAIADSIMARTADIQQANAQDLAAAREKGMEAAMLERLTLTEARIALMADGIRQIAALPDPVGEIIGMKTTEKGLQVGRMRAPIGTIGIIYESRPNVTADAAALCIKSGNTVILRGGSEAICSNRAIMQSVAAGLREAGLPETAVQLVPDTDRAHAAAMLQAAQYIDVIIPRGGRGLVKLISEEARMPVIKHLDGICHIYIDKDADLNKAVRIADNGKTYRYGICGATETLLVHAAAAADFLPQIAAIYREKGVEMRGDAAVCAIIADAIPAADADWAAEYHAAIISIRVVPDYDAAAAHIAAYSSKHTDAIVTENLTTAQRFLRETDSASVMVNTPTCFADGYEYGLGAEIGISTDKIHWRGPVGLEGLTSCKFIILSNGVLRG